MPEDNFEPRNHTTPQSIPLQDLSRPPDTRNGTGDWGRFGTSVSGRARALLGNRQAFSGRVNTTGRYERILAASSTETANNRQLDVPHIMTPRGSHQSTTFYDDGEISPIPPEFQAAMGSVGLSFDNDPYGPSGPPIVSTTSPSGRTQLRIISESEGPSPMSHPAEQLDTQLDDYFSPVDDDRSPLTDQRFLQPISGAQLQTPSGQRNDRNSSQSVRSSPGARLGDDLPTITLHTPGSSHSQHRMSSYSTRSLSRSLSTSGVASPLTAAGSIIRKMSQRVVNLSNEPEVLDQGLNRQHSAKMATLEGPPSFPAMTEYAHDEPLGGGPPSIEKPEPFITIGPLQETWDHPNPLKGKSLGIFLPDNPLRLWLCEVLVHPVTEPVLLVLILLQTILLAVDAAPSTAYNRRTAQWQSPFTTNAMYVLFTIYTMEIIARSIVSGFIKNADEYSTIDDHLGFRKTVYRKARALFAPHLQSHQKIQNPASINSNDVQPSILRSFTAKNGQMDQPGNSRQAQRNRLARRAFFRHSFTRLDFLAVFSFWTSTILSKMGPQTDRHIYVFQMLSCLRILRLLVLTRGTSVILRSLKKAAPLLVHVAFLIGFFWLLFAIVGAQVFKSSFRRTCVWYGTNATAVAHNSVTNVSALLNYTQNLAPGNVQFCGGHLDAVNGSEMPYVKFDSIGNLVNGSSTRKGYLCPKNSLCIEGISPYNGTVSFDNIFQALELVFVVMSSNTFSDLLYYTTDSDHLAAALFFSFGIVITSFWMINLLVAVITSSFQVIREESKTSAFTADGQSQLLDDEDLPKKKTTLKAAFESTYWFWILIITFGLVVQCIRAADSSPSRILFIDNTETAVTLVLLAEIILRFLSDWRNFHKNRRNWIDLCLAIITSIMQLPPIRNSGQAYAWMTFFQIVRVYRIVLAVPLTRELITIIFSNISGIANLILFVFLITFLVAIFAVQLFGGDIPDQDINQNHVRVTFGDIYNAFLGMYQVLSSENWTILMYNVTQYQLQYDSAWIGAAFFILWFILANFIVLNMFIAVIQESFDVTEDEKRMHQVKAFLQQKELVGSTHSTLSLSTIFKFGRNTGRKRDPLEYGPATIEMFKDTVVRDFLDEQMEALEGSEANLDASAGPGAERTRAGLATRLMQKISRIFQGREPNPFYSKLTFSRPYEDLDPRTMAKEIQTVTEQRKRAQRQYLQNHPTYNVPLFIFGPTNPLRRICQRIVGPGRGTQRYDGVDPYKPVWYAFSCFIYACIVAMVLLACIATPLYQRQYLRSHNQETSIANWFVWTDLGFAAVFTIEALIKIVADGIFWTPNAYFRSFEGFIDAVVLITLWISIATSLSNLPGIARSVGAFKALRALRLLNISDSARSTFHQIIVIGGWKVLSAAFVSLSFLIPFAIYGLNLFHGRLRSCNDFSNSGIQSLDDCVGEWSNTPFSNSNPVLSPRVVANPYYDFDNFGNSLFILFQIVSEEGWIDVMWQSMMITGKDTQPTFGAAKGNSVFFIIFNLLGSVFVLTLFVSIFMRNITEQTGVAFLTAEQRSWLEMRKLLRQISPSKRPTNQPRGGWKTWCYRLAVKKKGKWQKTVTGILLLHLILLCLEMYPEVDIWEKIRDCLFLSFTVFYIVNIVIRVVGLTWKRFRRSSWDLYSIMSVSGTVVTSILYQAGTNPSSAYRQVHKLFLVSIALLLIPRNNQLDQLFKTAAASLTVIANLLATWFIIFLVFAIALTQTLGLTKFSTQAKSNLNFRNVWKALILLFRMSCGEGWNQIMEDYAHYAAPPFCIDDPKNFFESDCGSAPWARFLFIAWNIISMYIFVSMFVSLIFESFSYVYQQSSGLSQVSRDETRRFKQAWATFDPEGTGYISKESFPKLLGELSGVFEMRIYTGEHTVNGILEKCRVETRGGESPAGVVHGVNLAKLNQCLCEVDVDDIRRRRARLELFSQEVMVSADPDRGISFSSVLMILAHYNVINDSKSLRLEEYLRRRHRLQRVEEEVRRRVVIGFFDTLRHSRELRRRKEYRHSARMMTIPQFAVPEIFVDDQDGPSPRIDSFPETPITPGADSALSALHIDTSPDRTRVSSYGSALGTIPPSPSGGLHTRGNSFGSSSPSRSDFSYNPSPVLGPRRGPDQGGSNDGYDSAFGLEGAADLSPLSRSRAGTMNTTTGSSIGGSGASGNIRHRRQQSSVGSRRNLGGTLEAFDNSAWGESIRRSFTIRRQGTKGRGKVEGRRDL